MSPIWGPTVGGEGPLLGGEGKDVRRGLVKGGDVSFKS